MGGYFRALPRILESEGGFVDHPDDPGGATNKGVTQRTYNAWREDNDLPERPVEEATDDEVESIYFDRYWHPAHCTEWRWPLDLAVFDAAVNHGPDRALKLLQAAAGTKADGIVGPKTRGAVESFDPRDLLRRLSWERAGFYARIVRGRHESASFIVGWIRRVRDLVEEYA